MADCSIRHRTDEWIEVVLGTPTYAGELGKAHSIMLGQLGLDGAATNDDVYEVIVGDDEIILRARQPSNRHSVQWAPGAIDAALATLLDYRDGNIANLPSTSQTVMVAIDTLRAIGAEPNGT